MKKTIQTALTAAMFTASLGAAAGNMMCTSASGQALTVEEALEYTETTVQNVYGPTTAPTSTTTTTTVPETTVEILYGPPSVLYNHGDLNMDKKLDARDLTLLKRRYLSGYTEVSWGELGDLDNDGELTKKDIKALQRQLTGKPEEEEEPITTTAALTEAPLTTTTATTFEDIPQPVYGPPEWFE